MINETFEHLNDSVNKVFFDGRNHGRPVYLDLEEDIANELEELLQLDKGDLDLYVGMTVAETLEWGQSNIYKAHLRSIFQWHADDQESPPPFTALLLAFSIAAERMRGGDEYSSNNYYQRLAELLDVDDDARKGKISSAGKYSLVFWKALNRWLLENDFAYGRPTARQVNNWKYVSYALSQSLVRDADRKRLQRMFADYGLSPHEALTESELYLYLIEWMAGHGPSLWLKKLWSVPDLRERVVSAAYNELESWEGIINGEGYHTATTRRLSWALVQRKFPKKRVYLYLCASVGEAKTLSDFQLGKEAKKLARDAFKECPNIRLNDLQGTDLFYVEPIEKLNLNALLLTSFNLVNADLGLSLRHEARAAIPLIKQEGGPFFREVSRISLFSNHMILCHENWKDQIQRYLDIHARPGYTVLEGVQVPGLPSEWALLQDVEVVQIPSESISNNLQSLVPLSEGVNIHLMGGLKLAQSIWHAKAPPEVFASDDDGLLGIRLSREDIQGKSEIILEQDAKGYDPNFISENEIELDNQNLVLSAIKGGRAKLDKDVAFRTANTPRKLLPNRDKKLAYSLGPSVKPFTGLSAVPLDELEENACYLQGMIAEGKDTRAVDIVDHGHSQLLDANYAEEDESKEYVNKEVKGYSETCILRGYHYWICAQDSSSMTCRDCGAFQLARKKPKGKRKRTKETYRRPSQNKAEIGEMIETRTSPDVIYDALCYVGTGTWSKLQGIVSLIVDMPWQVSIVTQKLIDLGLIDVMLNPDNGRPAYWYCPPACVVLTESNEAFLSGFRNEKMLADIKECLSCYTREYQVIEQELAPSVHLFKLINCDYEQLVTLLENVVDPSGSPVSVIRVPAERIAVNMPTVSEIIEIQKSVHIEDQGDIERFDVTLGKWKRSGIQGAGAYRTFHAGRHYVYKNADGETREASYELVKLLAARAEGVRLHAYNSRAAAFECVIGCEPPGLFRRALVSCSGQLPVTVSGKVIYENVPVKIAQIIMTKLYS